MTVADVIGPARDRATALAAFQAVLNALPTPMAQKTAITEAYGKGLIDTGDAELLIQVYQLETA